MSKQADRNALGQVRYTSARGERRRVCPSVCVCVLVSREPRHSLPHGGGGRFGTRLIQPSRPTGCRRSPASHPQAPAPAPAPGGARSVRGSQGGPRQIGSHRNTTLHSTADPLPVVLKSTMEDTIFQRYIGRPLLTNAGEKFELRLFVAITSLEPLSVYLYNDFYCRAAAQKYDLDLAKTHGCVAHVHCEGGWAAGLPGWAFGRGGTH